MLIAVGPPLDQDAWNPARTVSSQTGSNHLSLLSDRFLCGVPVRGFLVSKGGDSKRGECIRAPRVYCHSGLRLGSHGAGLHFRFSGRGPRLRLSPWTSDLEDVASRLCPQRKPPRTRRPPNRHGYALLSEVCKSCPAGFQQFRKSSHWPSIQEQTPFSSKSA